MNIDILGITELKWTGTGGFNSDDHCIYYCGQESLRRNGIALIVNKGVRNAVSQSVQLLNHDQLLENKFIPARQTSLSITNSQRFSNSCLSSW